MSQSCTACLSGFVDYSNSSLTTVLHQPFISLLYRSNKYHLVFSGSFSRARLVCLFCQLIGHTPHFFFTYNFFFLFLFFLFLSDQNILSSGASNVFLRDQFLPGWHSAFFTEPHPFFSPFIQSSTWYGKVKHWNTVATVGGCFQAISVLKPKAVSLLTRLLLPGLCMQTLRCYLHIRNTFGLPSSLFLLIKR